MGIMENRIPGRGEPKQKGGRKEGGQEGRTHEGRTCMKEGKGHAWRKERRKERRKGGHGGCEGRKNTKEGRV